MTEENSFSNEAFGDFLKRHREASGRTIDSIAKSTRISKMYLVAFEESDFSRFPPDAFARGFLRTYSQEIGIDPDEVVQKFESFRRATAPTQIRDLRQQPASLPSTKSPWMVWAVLGVIFVVGLFIFLIPSDRPEKSEVVETPTVVEAPADPANPAQVVIPPPPSQLSITALLNSELTIRVDDQPSEEMTFRQGEVRNISVYREVEIRNVPRGGFRFLYNGKPLEMTGPVLKLFNRNLMQP